MPHRSGDSKAKSPAASALAFSKVKQAGDEQEDEQLGAAETGSERDGPDQDEQPELEEPRSRKPTEDCECPQQLSYQPEALANGASRGP